MPDYNILLPSKPKVIAESELSGTYEIEGLYPGYGHTLGNSLRRIILSSLPGAAITKVKIEDVPHEFATINGVKEDVIAILLNLKRTRLKMNTDEPQEITLSAKGITTVTAKDLNIPGQVEVLNPDQHIATLTTKDARLDVRMTLEKGLGYVPKEVLQKEKMDIGTIALDASFTPIKRVNYEVENMRVGDRTDYNRLKISVETDGTLTPRQALERSIETMITQLKAVVGFKEDEPAEDTTSSEDDEISPVLDADTLKTRVEDLDISTRTINALTTANIRTAGGLARKSEADILELEGIGDKGVTEIKDALKKLGIALKS